MNEVATLTKFETNLVSAADSCDIARKEKNHTIQALKLAKGLSDLKRALLVPEVLNIIKELMNTPTGFVTDKDPNKKIKDKVSGQWVSPAPYPDSVIVDCVADAMSKGLTIHNNEFNIIVGRMYPAQSGFTRKLADFKRDNKIKAGYLPSIPVKRGNVYFCEAVAWWQKQGEERQEEIISWNLAAFSEDAALGKVKKRANEWLFNELSGNTWTSAEDYNDFNPIANEKDIDMPRPAPTKTPVIPISAILNAIGKAENIDILNEKWQKAQTTDHKDNQEVKDAYDKRAKELQIKMGGE